jgi:cbb3-type cytochrome oxidase maturation protein
MDMLPSSLTVTLAITILGLLTAAVFVWAWRKGQFDRINQQALLPLDDDDFNVARPWETAAQKSERQAEFGPPRPIVTPGIWGGAQ